VRRAADLGRVFLSDRGVARRVFDLWVRSDCFATVSLVDLVAGPFGYLARERRFLSFGLFERVLLALCPEGTLVTSERPLSS
jgi:hypothetical protein